MDTLGIILIFLLGIGIGIWAAIDYQHYRQCPNRQRRTSSANGPAADEASGS